MKTLLLVLAFLGTLQDDKQAEQALKDFRDAWSKAGRDESARSGAITGLYMTRHEKVLEVLMEKFAGEKSAGVREKIVGGVAQYTDSAKAAEFAAGELGRNEKMPNVMQSLFQALATIHPRHTRPHVAKVNGFVKHRELSFAVPAISALGRIRDKSSVPVLLERLRKAQQDMKEYIKGSDLPDCDGD